MKSTNEATYVGREASSMKVSLLHKNGEEVSGERRDLYSGILYIQWNLSIKGILNKGHMLQSWKRIR